MINNIFSANLGSIYASNKSFYLILTQYDHLKPRYDEHSKRKIHQLRFLNIYGWSFIGLLGINNKNHFIDNKNHEKSLVINPLMYGIHNNKSI